MIKFKVGDMVKCIKNKDGRSNSECAGPGWRLGHEFKIKKITQSISSETSIYWYGINGNGVFEKYLGRISNNADEVIYD